MPIADSPFKPISCLAGLVSLNIPSSWEVYEEGEWVWSCYDDASDTGTLWISVMLFARNNQESNEVESDKALIKVFSDHLVAQHGRLDAAQITESSRSIRLEKTIEEDGEELRSHWTHYLMARDSEVFIVSFHLVLSVEQLKTQEFTDFRVRMEKEIDNSVSEPMILR